jgi:hypothetical protein
LNLRTHQLPETLALPSLLPVLRFLLSELLLLGVHERLAQQLQIHHILLRLETSVYLVEC